MLAMTAADPGVIRRPLAYSSCNTVFVFKAQQMSTTSCRTTLNVWQAGWRYVEQVPERPSAHRMSKLA